MPLSLLVKVKNHVVWRLKSRLISWLSVNLDQHKQGYIHASVAPTAKIFPVAELSNHTGNADNMVVGDNSVVLGKLLTHNSGGRITIGEWCYVGHRTEIWSMSSVCIGNRVLISHNVSITDSSAHSLNSAERHLHYKHIVEKGHPDSWEDLPGISAAPVIIEDDAWISFGVTILKGVRIGAGSVIAAGSIVTKDVPPGMLYRNEVKPIIQPL